MSTDKKVLGIIPARGGSKSIPRKNIKPFFGKPLLAWTVEAGLASGVLDRLILTTNDEEIAAVGRGAGAEVPFMRPGELAEDTTPTLPVVQHAVKWLRENEQYSPDYVVLLEPTSPGRRPWHIKEAVELLVTTGADSVASMRETPGHFNPHWQFKLGAENRIETFIGEPMGKIVQRRQDLPKTYVRNGVIYAFKTSLLFADQPSFYGNDFRAYLMEEEYSLDIDSLEDWVEAEKTFKQILDEERGRW